MARTDRAVRRERLTELDDLTARLRDGADRLARQVAAVEREVASWRRSRT